MISIFETWCWDVIFVLFSAKVTCTWIYWFLTFHLIWKGQRLSYFFLEYRLLSLKSFLLEDVFEVTLLLFSVFELELTFWHKFSFLFKLHRSVDWLVCFFTILRVLLSSFFGVFVDTSFGLALLVVITVFFFLWRTIGSEKRSEKTFALTFLGVFVVFCSEDRGFDVIMVG